MKPYSIVLSADVLDQEKLLDLIDITHKNLDGIKIHLFSLIQGGNTLIKKLLPYLSDKSLILDLKIGDIGFQNSNDEFEGSNKKIIDSVKELINNHEDTYVTIHGFPGPISVKECVEVSHKNNINVLLIPYMSHEGADVFYNAICGTKPIDKKRYKKYLMEFNLVYPQTVYDSILGLGEQFGVDGYIGPSNDLDILRSYRRITNKLIVSPGFGRQSKGLPIEQQFYYWAKVVGPDSAAIIGSLIYNNPEPNSILLYINNIKNAFVEDVTNLKNWINDGEPRKFYI